MNATPAEPPPVAPSPLATLRVATPLGPFVIAADHAGLVRVSRVRATDEEQVDAARPSDADRHCAQAAAELAAYFAGTLRAFTVPLRLAGPPFQERVWHQMRAIPYGATQTYGDLALQLGDTGASRAVGIACGANPIPLIVPCHRVVAAGGALGGFGLGREAKIWLLEHEGARARQLALF